VPRLNPAVMLLVLASVWTIACSHFDRTALGAESPNINPTSILQGRMDYQRAAAEVTSYVQTTFYLPRSGLYAHASGDKSPDFTWGNGVMFSALVGAARHYPEHYQPIMNHFFLAMNAYWDKLSSPPGYEPAPTRGGGNDKYYDDNAWMVLTFTEAYELTHNAQYLDRARDCLDFTLSGWDDTLGGGIWWHVAHKGDSKNVCVNSPAAVGCLRMATDLPPQKAQAMVLMAEKIVKWTDRYFRDSDGLYTDSIVVSSGKINPARLTYNTGLMIRALLELSRVTGNRAYFLEAQQSADAADWFLSRQTHAYRDAFKWSHLLVEADLEMFRATGRQHYLERALDNGDYAYSAWKQNPPAEMIDNASVARMLWLLADVQSNQGRRFWQKMDSELAPVPKS
jgi:hypothetical protein